MDMAAKKGNKYAIGNTGGRPRMYKTPKAMAKVIDDYFFYIKGEKKKITEKIKDEKTGKITKFVTEEWAREPEPATITGLILFLGFAHREALLDYKKKKEFSDTVQRGYSRVEHEYEKRLSAAQPAGPIFALKNMGWKDKVETGFTDNEGNDITPSTYTIIKGQNADFEIKEVE